ncbi:carotenoid ester lipase precursor [Lactarius psammicola]|nr:carotenoid ester lipase precursor [Lactarius psammicola]
MHITHFALALFANQAAFVLANSIRSLTIQKFDAPAAQAGFCKGVGSPPLAYLDSATFSGVCNGRAAQFLGIPYAQPPTCGRRLRLPEPLPPYEGFYDVHKFGPSCPQQRMVLPTGLNSQLEKDISNIVATLYEDVTTDHEDCLTINVFTPENATPTSKLPVLVWIFGGGFEIGGTANKPLRQLRLARNSLRFPASASVSALGFLPGKEVKAAKIGNLGLQDQRLALKWIQKYITAFGGDPSKVTIWGESAGAISSIMVIKRACSEARIMQSGGPIPVGDIEHASGQEVYDTFVKNAACDNSPDTLECLRSIPYPRLKYAMDISPNFFAYQVCHAALAPVEHAITVCLSPWHGVLSVLTGNCDDEVTDGSDTKGVENYLKTFMLPTATNAEIDLLLQYYPDDPQAGSSKTVGLSRGKNTPFVGSVNPALSNVLIFGAALSKAHATDLLNSFGGQELTDYFIYFARNLDPNGNLEIPWPRYDVRKPMMLVFQDSPFFPVIVGTDDYRVDPLNFVANLSLLHPI